MLPGPIVLNGSGIDGQTTKTSPSSPSIGRDVQDDKIVTNINEQTSLTIVEVEEEDDENTNESIDDIDVLTILNEKMPPSKMLETRDSISSIDSDVSLSYDVRHRHDMSGSNVDESDDCNAINSNNEEEDELKRDDDKRRRNNELNRRANEQDRDGNDSKRNGNDTDRDGNEQIRNGNKEIRNGNELNRDVIDLNRDVTDLNENCRNLTRTNETSLRKKTTTTSSSSNNNEDDHEANLADLSDSCSDTGGKDSGCEVSQTELQEPPFRQPDDELADRIVQQVEFYFSDSNITKDAFLLKHVKRNKEGYVSLKLISSFKRVKHITKDWRVVAYALKRSKRLQVNETGTKLRRVDPLPKYDETIPSRTIVAVNMPIEKPTIENVAELFRDCGEISLIRVLRPGNPIPADVRQFINKNPSLSGTLCALIEFVQSESARNALELNNLKATTMKVYELNGVPHPERKKKNNGNGNNQTGSGGNNNNNNNNNNKKMINGVKNCYQPNCGGHNATGTFCHQTANCGCICGYNACHQQQQQQNCALNNNNNNNKIGCQLSHQHHHHPQQQQHNNKNCQALQQNCCNQQQLTTTSPSQQQQQCQDQEETVNSKFNANRRCLRRGFSAHFPSKSIEPVAWLQRRLSASSTEANFMFMPRRLSYGSNSSTNSSSGGGGGGNNSNNGSDLNLTHQHHYHHHHHQQQQQQHSNNNQQQYRGINGSSSSINSSSIENICNNANCYMFNHNSRRMSSNSCGSNQSLNDTIISTRSRSNSGAFQQNENVLRLPKGPDGSKGFKQRITTNNNNNNNCNNNNNNVMAATINNNQELNENN